MDILISLVKNLSLRISKFKTMLTHSYNAKQKSQFSY